MEPILAALEVESFLGRLAVKFERVEGRYSHAIEILGDESRTTAFQSVENPSLTNIPCFTELHVQDKTLFLTGANGPCHWSMSVQIGELCRSVEFDGEKAIAPPRAQFVFFDVACRLKEQIIEIGSEYSKPEGFNYTLGSIPHTGLALSAANLPVWFGVNRYIEKEASQRIKFQPEPKCSVTFDGSSTLRFSALDASMQKFPATVQWSYAFWM